MPTDPRFRNLTGLEFENLTVKKFAGKRGSHHAWECVCICGTPKTIRGDHLTSGATVSCGCIRGKSRCTHGKTETREYVTWCNIKSRCYSKNHVSYDRYGARGIRVCRRWKNSFENFLADMGERPSKEHSIERVNNLKNYSPSNCKWATRKEQGRNKRNNRVLRFRGKSCCVSEWAELTGLPMKTLHRRIQKGWSVERALTTPVKKRAKK